MTFQDYVHNRFSHAWKTCEFDSKVLQVTLAQTMLSGYIFTSHHLNTFFSVLVRFVFEDLCLLTYREWEVGVIKYLKS